MKRIMIIVSLMIAIVVPLVFWSSKMYSVDPDLWAAMGLDPNASSVSISLEELEARTVQAALNRPDLFTDDYVNSVRGNAGQSTSPAASQQASSATDKTGSATGKTKTKQVPANKVTATFKNLYGVIIGTSQITKGTDIAKSQFPKGKVPDIVTPNGTYVFDHWNYDGSKLTDDISVKAV